MSGMNTVKITPEQMRTRIARLKDMRPQAEMYGDENAIPKEAYEAMAAKELFLFMAPACQGGPMAQQPAIEGREGLSVIIARCPPGNKPILHAHMKTNESFMCLTGRFRIRWGDDGEDEIYLDPYEMIAVPPGVCRDFTNVSDEDALLLVLITGTGDDDYNDILVAPEDSRRLRDRFGEKVIAAFEQNGMEFVGLDR